MKRILIILLTCSSCLVHYASIVKHDVFAIAATCLNTDHIAMIRNNDSYSIFNCIDKEGFVIILHGDDNTYSIAGYSLTCDWNEDDMPSVVLRWLETLSRKKCRHSTRTITRNNDRIGINPLLSCHWHQDSPYNDLAPYITDGHIKSVAGCVAIAASQIAYYWRRDNPQATLKDTPVYPYGAAPVVMSIPKGSPNSWELMLDVYKGGESEESRYAVAQLCYVLGTTSYLNYAISTGGQINDAANALHMQYSLISTYKSKPTNYEEWDKLLYQELLHGRPVLCSGVAKSGGHAFVLDGYDQEKGLYHFNFGWGGAGDGYYPIDDSEESMGGYFEGQSIVYDIHPLKRNISADMSCSYADHENRHISISYNVTNNSTLPIKELRVYIVPENKTLQEIEVENWQGEGAANDNNMISGTITIDNPSSPGNVSVILTDENKYVLAQTDFDIKTGILSILNNDEGEESLYYDMRGQKILGVLKPGFYIRKNANGVRKYVIK